ncbi:MAG: hypothetical protein H6640_21390 [Caldilineaceae bacterium]|nr:hypothetical protein [Caldilineaceae bacterium]
MTVRRAPRVGEEQLPLLLASEEVLLQAIQRRTAKPWIEPAQVKKHHSAVALLRPPRAAQGHLAVLLGQRRPVAISSGNRR